MQLTVLAVPGCPNAPVLTDRLVIALHGWESASVSYEVISDEAHAVSWGMHGSPTLLIDGADPFAEPGQPPTMSCRLYRDDTGRAAGAPSVAQIRRALEWAEIAAGDAAEPTWLDSLGRAGRGRVAPSERGLRAVHQAVLQSFVSTGVPPDKAGLAAYAAPFDVAEVLADLASNDFLCVDQAGNITAAYPFSARPTRHRVRLADNAAAFAMCAIDALGMSAMTGRPVVIESADPSTGQPITVKVDGVTSTWHPVTAVVYVGRAGGKCAGPSASVCCDYMNFFTTGGTAAAWAGCHPEVRGGILSQGHALQVGIGIFAQLLSTTGLA
jgi:hypothetical protein